MSLSHVTSPAPLDPEIADFRDQLAARYQAFGDLSPLSFDEARAVIEQVRAPFREGGPAMHSCQEFCLKDGVTLRLYRPSNQPQLPVLIYLHGGGWTYFSIDTHDRLMREYAAQAGVAVLGVNYRLAPEHPSPAALDDCLDAIAWLKAQSQTLGLDSQRLALGGDSAGGYLSLASALALKAQGSAMVKALLLNYPALDPRCQHASFTLYDGPDYVLARDEMLTFWQHYLGDAARDDPKTNLALANVSGLPPSLVVVAECDVLADEGLQLAARMQQAGVTSEAKTFMGATHSFIEAMASAKVARQAIAAGADWLRRYL
ncbi:alpha/beta hydrolase [Gallaecimonas mangrovi]|uniref:alpha/beta hydrolase n=1 Tax=Gallaecimonas mangrovi TaxID=2291597 RepID=UPI000E1FE6FB|nr:alpha/beta hydrolase [Gallaecimonas mangrovi]